MSTKDRYDNSRFQSSSERLEIERETIRDLAELVEGHDGHLQVTKSEGDLMPRLTELLELPPNAILNALRRARDEAVLVHTVGAPLDRQDVGSSLLSIRRIEVPKL